MNENGSMVVLGTAMSDDMSVKMAVNDLEFRDQYNVKRSLREMYQRFEVLEGRDMMRGMPSTTPVSKQEYEDRINRLEAIILALQGQLEKAVANIDHRVKTVESDLADRPQTTATW
jgi:hypothetical protein